MLHVTIIIRINCQHKAVHMVSMDMQEESNSGVKVLNMYQEHILHITPYSVLKYTVSVSLCLLDSFSWFPRYSLLQPFHNLNQSGNSSLTSFIKKGILPSEN